MRLRTLSAHSPFPLKGDFVIFPRKQDSQAINDSRSLMSRFPSQANPFIYSCQGDLACNAKDRHP